MRALTVALLLCAASTAAAQATAPARVLVYELETEGMEPRRALLLNAALRAEIAKTDGVTLVNLPEAGAESDRCIEPAASCLVRLAQALGAEVVVFGNATALGASKVLVLKSLRIQDGAIEGTVTRRLTGAEGEEYLLTLGDAVGELFAARGMRSDAVRGVPYPVVRRWTPPPLPPAVPIAGAGLTLAGAVFSLVSWAQYRSAVEDANAYAQLGLSQPIEGRELVDKQERAKELQTRTRLGGAVTAGVALGTVLTYFFTDWDNDDEALRLLGPSGDGTLAGAALSF
jgi:hypothetical protein